MKTMILLTLISSINSEKLPFNKIIASSDKLITINPSAQIECLKDSIPECHLLTNVDCYINSESHWKCEADVPNDIIFSYIKIDCEGYEHIDGSYILKGPCQLLIKLDYIEKNYPVNIIILMSIILIWSYLCIRFVIFIANLASKNSQYLDY